MNKTKLERFILKYNLGGTVDSVKWKVKNNVLGTSFITADRSLLGKVIVDNFQFENATIGVYSTNQLYRMLCVMGDNVDLSLTKIDNKAISLNISDTNASADFMLADLSVIGDPHAMNNIPAFGTKIDIDTRFINTFIKGKNALTEADSFTIMQNGNVKVVIGHSTINSNRVTIPVTTTEASLVDYLSFDANIFKEILLANRECTSATLEIANEGLAHIIFKVDEYVSEYYITSLQGNV
jgi:hypothetical protein